MSTPALAEVVAAGAGTGCKSHRSFVKYDFTPWECAGQHDSDAEVG